MEDKFIIRVTRYYWVGDVRLHYREVYKFDSFSSFSKCIKNILTEDNYRFEYFITSTSTPSCPFVRWSKKTRKPVGFNGLFRGLVWTEEDKKNDIGSLIR